MGATEQGVSLLTKEEDKDKETATLSLATTMEENNDCHSGLWFCTGRDDNDGDIKVEGPSKEVEEVTEDVATEQVELLVKDEENEEKQKPRALSSATATTMTTTTNANDIYTDRENDGGDDVKVEVEEEEGKAGRNKEEEEIIKEEATEQMVPLVKEKEDDEKEKPEVLPSATTTNINDI